MRTTLLLSFIVVATVLSSCDIKPSIIGIQPLGNVNSVHVDSVFDALTTIYGAKVVVLPKVDIPESAFVNIKSPRYRADSLLYFLLKNQPAHVDYTIGIISKDISTTKYADDGKIKKPEEKYRDWGIFGLGFRPGRSCIVSTFRLHGKNGTLFYSRLKKVSVHEIGHNAGLPHCPETGCVMQDAVESIETVDKAGPDLCDKCKSQLLTYRLNRL